MDDTKQDQLYPFFVIELPNDEVKRSKLSPHFRQDTFTYSWEEIIKYKYYSENLARLTLEYLVIQVWSNKSNTISGAKFLGEIELDMHNLFVGPQIHECTLLHSSFSGTLSFNVGSIQYAAVEIEVTTISLSEIDIMDRKLFLTYHLSSGEKKQKYQTIEYSNSKSGKSWSFESKSNSTIVDNLSYFDLCDNEGGLIVALRASNKFLSSSKLGECIVPLKDLWLKNNITIDLLLNTHDHKIYTLSLTLTIHNPPRYIQSNTGKHTSTTSEHIFTDLHIIEGAHKLQNNTEYIKCIDCKCEPSDAKKTITFSPLRFNLKSIYIY